MRSPRNPLALLLFVVAALAVGRFGAAVTGPALESWYRALAKPPFTPPDWVFPLAWTLIYLMMALAAWLVWRAGGRAALGALCLWSFQLLLNGLWSFVFFGLKNPGLALLEILLLLAAVLATTVAFARHSRSAALLFLPYLAWLAYAALLNLEIWRLN